jgi:hypothetical protein
MFAARPRMVICVEHPTPRGDAIKQSKSMSAICSILPFPDNEK